LTGRLGGVLLLAAGATGAGGLGLFVGGGRPGDILHFVYAVVALGAVPIAASLSQRASPRQQGVATVLGAVVALIVIARLFQTG